MAAGCSPDEVPPVTGVSTTSWLEQATTAGDGTLEGEGDLAGTSGPIRLADLAPGWLTGNFARCPECHSLLDQPGKVYPSLTSGFQHGFHLADGTQCADCHLVPTHTQEGIKHPTMDKCFGCHSQEDASGPPGGCSACHPSDFSLKPLSHDDPNWLPAAERRDSVRGQHTNTEVEDRQKQCGLCHGPTFCTDCHKLDMPHPDGWRDEHSTVAKQVGGSACRFCHPERQACAACHHKGYEPGGPPWVELHPSVVHADGAAGCIGCHSSKTCAHCHVTGEYEERE